VHRAVFGWLSEPIELGPQRVRQRQPHARQFEVEEVVFVLVLQKGVLVARARQGLHVLAQTGQVQTQVAARVIVQTTFKLGLRLELRYEPVHRIFYSLETNL
jgi:hypothetical protein